MVRISIIAGPLCTLAAALVAGPLAAQGTVTVKGQPELQETVSFADLDLRGWSARQTLNARVYGAADRLCAKAAEPFAPAQIGVGSAPTCRQLTYDSVAPQIRAAIARARSGQATIATNLVVSAPPAR
jgi:UrcA family protein